VKVNVDSLLFSFYPLISSILLPVLLLLFLPYPFSSRFLLPFPLSSLFRFTSSLFHLSPTQPAFFFLPAYRGEPQAA
jgi:hypothetical protein